MTTLKPESLVKVTNRSNGSVVYRIPERHIRREFNRQETKRVPYQEILEVAAQPGGRNLLYNFLLIDSEEAIKEGLNIQAEPEYWLTEAKIKGGWMETSTLEEFKDALDFAPEGVKALIKNYAVTLPLNDVAKRQALLDQLKFDVTKAIANKQAEAETDNAKDTKIIINSEASNSRRSTPSYKPSEEATTSNYKIVTPKA